MKALFVDGPMSGKIEEFPCETWEIDVAQFDAPAIQPSGNLVGESLAHIITYRVFATDFHGLRLFRMKP